MEQDHLSLTMGFLKHTTATLLEANSWVSKYTHLAAACSSTAPCQGMKEKESFIMKEKEMKEDQHIST